MCLASSKREQRDVLSPSPSCVHHCKCYTLCMCVCVVNEIYVYFDIFIYNKMPPLFFLVLWFFSSFVQSHRAWFSQGMLKTHSFEQKVLVTFRKGNVLASSNRATVFFFFFLSSRYFSQQIGERNIFSSYFPFLFCVCLALGHLRQDHT